MNRRFITWGLVPLSLLSMCLPTWAWEETLTILHTNDTHAQLLPFDSQQGKQLGGIARRAAFFRSQKDRNPLILDAGDVFQGTPLYNFFLGEPDITAMSMAGYHAMCTGNHDFDNGLVNLQTQMKHATFPVLNANLTDAKGNELFKPYAIFKRGQTRIAIIGLLGEDAFRSIALKNTREMRLLPPLLALNRWLPEMQTQADVIVALTHAGLEEDVKMAKATDGLDLIVGGHSHTQVNQPMLIPNERANGLKGTLVVQAYQWGHFVGDLSLTVKDGKLSAYKGHLTPITPEIELAPDDAIARYVNEYGDRLKQAMGEKLGTATETLVTYGKAGPESPLGRWLADLIQSESKADLAFINSGGIRADLPAGPVTMEMIYRILPFDNAIVTMELDGESLLTFLKVAAERLETKGRTFQFSKGFAMKVEKGKMLSVSLHGKPIEPNKTYRLATIDFVAAGNEGPYFLKAEKMDYTGTLLRDAAVAAIRKDGTIKGDSELRVR